MTRRARKTEGNFKTHFSNRSPQPPWWNMVPIRLLELCRVIKQLRQNLQEGGGGHIIQNDGPGAECCDQEQLHLVGSVLVYSQSSSLGIDKAPGASRLITSPVSEEQSCCEAHIALHTQTSSPPPPTLPRLTSRRQILVAILRILGMVGRGCPTTVPRFAPKTNPTSHVRRFGGQPSRWDCAVFPGGTHIGSSTLGARKGGKGGGGWDTRLLILIISYWKCNFCMLIFAWIIFASFWAMVKGSSLPTSSLLSIACHCQHGQQWFTSHVHFVKKEI